MQKKKKQIEAGKKQLDIYPHGGALLNSCSILWASSNKESCPAVDAERGKRSVRFISSTDSQEEG